MRIYLDQIGCRLNYSEMESLAQRLAAAGHAIVEDPAAAHVVIFNSCAVTGGAVRDSRKRVGALHRAAPGARIALTGCYATLAPHAAAALPGVALVAENSRKELLPLLLEPWSAEFTDTADLARLLPDAAPFDFLPATRAAGTRTRAFVKVQDGCNNRCTFCIVTSLRGDSRSRTVREVVAEIAGYAAQGVQEAVLTGVHLGAYGRDLLGAQASDLKDLVAAILADTNIPRLRLSSLEPWDLAPGFFDLWARWPHRLCPHLHLPLQAGTDRQLRAMARRCTAATYLRLLEEARAAIPDLVVTTDLIAGFPGETADDFGAGLAFVEECRFAHAHVFPFSAREGTAAARFGGQVAPEVKKARVQRLQAVVAATGRAERRRFIGAVRPVLWEGQGEPVPGTGQACWTGLTDNYLRVQAYAPSGAEWRNRIMPARLHEDAHPDGGMAEARSEGVDRPDALFEVHAHFVA
jgi:threonylcarbamoyladenosine tRNA methylthiotransferase MtaB